MSTTTCTTKTTEKERKSNEEYTISEKLSAVCELGRLKFLSYSPMMYTIGSIIAVHYDKSSPIKSINLHSYLLGWFSMSMVHAMTHYFNEWRDYDTDSINETVSPWTGGSQVLVKGKLSVSTALRIGILLLTFISCTSIYMIYMLNNYVAAFVVLAGAIFSIQYSLPPITASRHCLGEVWVTITLNIMLPMFGYSLQRYNNISINSIESLYNIEGPPLVFWNVLIPIATVEYFRTLVMNMSDIAADSKVNKITLAVFLGHTLAAKVHNIGMVLAYIIGILIFSIYDESDAPKTVFMLFFLTAPYCIYYAQLLHIQPIKYEMPYYATQHNAACMLCVYFGLLLPQLVKMIYYGTIIQEIESLGFLLPILIIITSLKQLFDNTKRGTKVLMGKMGSFAGSYVYPTASEKKVN